LAKRHRRPRLRGRVSLVRRGRGACHPSGRHCAGRTRDVFGCAERTRNPPVWRGRRCAAVRPSGGETRPGQLTSSDPGTRQAPTSFGRDAGGGDPGTSPACREGEGRSTCDSLSCWLERGVTPRQVALGAGVCDATRTLRSNDACLGPRCSDGRWQHRADISPTGLDGRPSRAGEARASGAAYVSARQPRTWEGRSGEAIHRDRPRVPKTVKARSWRSQGHDGCAEPIRHQVAGTTALRSSGEGDERRRHRR
jgi:hypothetical protein